MLHCLQVHYDNFFCNFIRRLANPLICLPHKACYCTHVVIAHDQQVNQFSIDSTWCMQLSSHISTKRLLYLRSLPLHYSLPINIHSSTTSASTDILTRLYQALFPYLYSKGKRVQLCKTRVKNHIYEVNTWASVRINTRAIYTVWILQHVKCFRRYICTYACMHTHVHTHRCTHTHTYTHMCTHTRPAQEDGPWPTQLFVVANHKVIKVQLHNHT